MRAHRETVLIAAVCGVLVAHAIFAVGLGCGVGAAPSAADQAAVATYAGDLEGCIVTAKATDAGMAGYLACKARVNALFGIGTDGGKP